MTNVPYRRVTPDGCPQQIEWHDDHIGDDGDGDNEFGELPRTPGTLKVLAAIEEGSQVQKDGEDVLLDKGGREEGPWVVEESQGNESQVGDDDRHSQLGFAGGATDAAYLAPSGDVVEQGKGEETDETDAGCRRNVNSDHFEGKKKIENNNREVKSGDKTGEKREKAKAFAAAERSAGRGLRLRAQLVVGSGRKEVKDG